MPTRNASAIDDRLRQLYQRMNRPQRHRLLHGYPLAAAMHPADKWIKEDASAGDPPFFFPRREADPLLIGVLPHPFCNPKIRGCGFCTFPHESFSSANCLLVANSVMQEIDDRLLRQPELRNARVDALYFGGGTANLTPREPFERLARLLDQTFDLSAAEVSLEGVPNRFLQGNPLLMDVMQAEMNARHFRISMGIQTFCETTLRRMGRSAFGAPKSFIQVVEAAHERGMTTSGDLLFNLPDQPLGQMKDDISRAVDTGLDQICLYHLVMFRGLGTEWSRDEALLASLPNNWQAAENWMVLREQLLAQGYRQTSLTNFELCKFESNSRRYQYESISYDSHQTHVLGFGPGGISYALSPDGKTAVKTLTPDSSLEYVQAVHSGDVPWNRYFIYDHLDLQVLYLTRRLAALHIDKQRLTSAFGEDALDGCQEQLGLFVAEGLIAEDQTSFTLKPRGMFFSDAIATMLVDELRQNHVASDASASHHDNRGGYM